MREAGFKPDLVELLQKDMKLQGKEGLVDWIRSVWLPFTERVPVSLRDSFISEIADRYLAAYPLDETGIVYIKMMRLEVKATKIC